MKAHRPIGCRRLGSAAFTLAVLSFLAQGEVAAGNVWVKLGPDGGPIREFVQNPAIAGILYVGTDSGVFRSTDGGAEWRSVNRGLAASSITALAVAPSNPSRLFAAGTGTQFVSSEDLSRVFRTSDGGDTWQTLTLPGSGSPGLAQPTHEIVIDPVNDDIVYLVRSSGVLKSTDGGDHWEELSLGLPTQQCPLHSLVLSEQASGVLFVGTYCGVYKSTDSGKTWRLSSSGMVQGSDAPPSISDLLIHPLNHCLIWASSSPKLWRSTDCGETWGELPQIGLIRGLVPDTKDVNRLYGITPDGVYRTNDSGLSWTLLATLTNLVPNGIWVDRSDSGVLWLGTSLRGLFRSTDAGSTWQSRNSGLTAISISGVSIDPRDSDVVYAGTNYKTIDGGSSWIELCTTGPRLCSRASTGLLGAPVHMVIDPAYPDTLYLPIREAVIKSQDRGINWSLVGAGLPKLRAPWLVGSPVQSGVLYASAGGLFKSTDGALNFSPLTLSSSPPITTYDVAVDWHDPNLVYAGTLEGVLTSADGGQSWRPPGQGLAEGGGSLETDPHGFGVVYRIAGALWRSVDAGLSWYQVLPDLGIQALAIDRSSSRKLYAYSTVEGVIRSTDGGFRWHTLNTGLPEFADGYIRAHYIAIAVDDPSIIYLATDQGVFRMHEQAIRGRRPRSTASGLGR